MSYAHKGGEDIDGYGIGARVGFGVRIGVWLAAYLPISYKHPARLEFSTWNGTPLLPSTCLGITCAVLIYVLLTILLYTVYSVHRITELTIL